MASVSSKLYDAFISHRGPDVKETLAKQLYELLEDRGCRTFLDRPEMEVGDSLSSVINNAICSSVVQIAIFSQGYANSSWCLDELVLVLHQRDHKGARFIPVFYDVAPYVLRYIQEPYAKALSEYEHKGRNLDKMQEWKRALQTASHLVGFERSRSGNDEKLCEETVSCVEKEIKRRIPLQVAPYPIGFVNFNVVWTGVLVSGGDYEAGNTTGIFFSILRKLISRETSRY